MIDKELAQKKDSQKKNIKKINEQWNQMLEDYFFDKEMEEIRKKQKRKANADMRKLKRMVQNKKDVDDFVKKLKEQENDF